MVDTRIFRVSYEEGAPEYANKRSVVQKYRKWDKGYVILIEATNAEATAGWTDVTEEFRLYGSRA